MADFDNYLREWACSACHDWSTSGKRAWPEPGPDYYAAIVQRLPLGLREILASGVAEGLVIPHGWRFTLKDLSSGPYQWFSRRAWQGGPHPNWEYFVQVAEFVRFHRLARIHDFRLIFEDDHMDLALYRGESLVICVEVKERAAQLRRLIAGIRQYEGGVDTTAKDRGNDALRKAKYIVKHHPPYFCGVALGIRLEYRVDYPQPGTFQLVEDWIPAP